MALVKAVVPLLIVSAGVSLSPQGVQKARQWIRETFYAPPQLSSSSSSVVSSQVSSEQASTPVIEVPAPQTPPAPPPITEVLASKGYIGCTHLSSQRGKKNLYVCWKRDNKGINKPSFFYYDRSRFKLTGDTQVNQIEIMTNSSSSRNVTLQFKEGNPKELDYPSPFWMKNFKNGRLKPDEHCELRNSNNGKSPYDLFCKNGHQEHEIQKGIHI